MSLKMPDDFENLTGIEYGYDGGFSIGEICLMAVVAGVGISLVCSVGGAIYDRIKNRGYPSVPTPRSSALTRP